MTAETNTTDHKRLIGWVGAFVGALDGYNDIGQEDRDDFNIFDALGIAEKELYHSKIIAAILNPDGQNGSSASRLCHFIELLKSTAGEASTIKNAGILQGWKCEGTRVDTERTGDHGRVDILLRDGSKDTRAIVIENKIQSGEREEQLTRYRDDYPKALLVFLTLDEKEAITAYAKNDYLPLSYKKGGVQGWIQTCEQEAARYPALRESLIQYRKTIQVLTEERIDVMEERNNVMKEKLCKIITADKESLRAALEIKELDIYGTLLKENVIPALEEHADKEYADKGELKFGEINESWGQKGYGFSFYRTEGKAFRIWFEFEFENSQMDNLFYGFWHDTNETTVPKKVRDTFLKIKDSRNQSGSGSTWKELQKDGWLLYRYMDEEFLDWNADRWAEFQNPSKSEAFKHMADALDELLGIADKHDIPL